MTRYRLEENRLTVTGELREKDHKEFEKWCRKLLDAGVQVVEADLTDVRRIHSRCLAALVTLQLDLRAVGRKLRLIPSPQVEKILEIGGLASLLMPESQA